MKDPLRVLIDARMLIGRFAGVARFVTELVEEMTQRDDLRVIALCGSEFPKRWAGRSDVEVLPTGFGRRDRTPCRRLIWEERHLPALIRQSRADLYHATWNSGIPARCPVPAILTVHDLIPWHEPRAHFASRLQRLCYRHAIGASVRRAARVATVSEYVRQDVLDTLRPTPTKTVVIPNGVKLHAANAAGGTGTARQSPPYALYVGGHQERKNVAGLLKALHHYWSRFGPTLGLHLTGTRESLAPAASRRYRTLSHPELIRFLGFPDDAALAGEYASAAMFVTLSQAEGFGLPVLEAMAAACPVVAARRASLPEIVGEAGVLVDPDDGEEVIGAMLHVLTDASFRTKLISLGNKRVRTFTWSAVANRYRALHRQVIRETPDRRPLQSRARKEPVALSATPAASSRPPLRPS